VGLSLIHLLGSVIALAVTLALSSFTINRLVKRKLRLSVFLLSAYALLHIVFVLWPDLDEDPSSELVSFENLTLTAALINLVVVALLNPLRVDRVPDRFPSIVQDAFVIGTLMLVATFAFGPAILATSAIGAVVLGFALQDTLGNAFAGLAIQSEKPFNIGHWITVGEHEGRVAEVTWRATKLRTKAGNFVVVPNSEIGKAAITNYSQPAAPMRLFIEVGVSYDAQPNRVKSVILEALGHCALVLTAPTPDVLIHDFADSSVLYRVRFWIEDFERDSVAADQVRSAVYYAFRRSGIEIPFPIQTEIQKEWVPPDEGARVAERLAVLGRLELFTPLDEEQRKAVAAATRIVRFGTGEAIVREGDPGDSMYIVVSGCAAVVTGPDRRELARIQEGDYFGEMSLLTGERRSATVVAHGDADLLEITAPVFRNLADVSPQTVERVGIAAAARRTELEGVRAAAPGAAVAEAPGTFLTRMRKFLRI
jgi:small-conductance mechanosensitive channel